MRIPCQKSSKFVSTVACLAFTLLARNAVAAFNYWDPTSPPNGNWEDSAWSTVTTGGGQGAFQEGILAVFSANGIGAGNFTVNVAANHSTAGIFNGGISGSTPSTGLVISGPGILSFSGLQGFYTSASTDNTTILVQLAGATGQVENEGSGSLFLYGTNTYGGGTLLGTGAGLNFNNSKSFGTGTITWGVANTLLATPAADPRGNTGATGPITIANPVTTISGTQIFAGLQAAPVTFSGPWTLPGAGVTVFQNQLVGGATGTPLVIISGAISGNAGFTKAGSGVLALSGANSYSGGTTATAGTLSITADNNLGAVPGSAALNLTLSGATFNASNTFTLNSKRLISLGANTTITVSSGKTMTYGGAISGAFNLTKGSTGTLALSGANGYTGSTTISAGTLEADSQTGSAVGTNTVLLQASGTLSGNGVVSGLVSGNGKVAPGTAAGPATLTLGNGLDLSTGGTYTWNLSANSTSGSFSTISLIGGNLNLGGTSKLSVNFSGTASAPATNNPFWLTQEAWTVVSVNGAAGNSGSTKFASLVNGTYGAGNFTNYMTGNGSIVLLYQPNYAIFDTIYDAGHGFFGGENLQLTNFSGLTMNLWSSTNAYLAVSNWTLVGQMAETSLAPALPGYSRYAMNVTPTVSPTFYVAGNKNTGPYIISPVPASIITTPDFSSFTVIDTNVAISASGVLALLPARPVFLPGGSTNSSSGFQLQFSAATNQSYTIQASSDLITWSNIASGTVSSSPVTFIDPTATNNPIQFYRVALPSPY